MGETLLRFSAPSFVIVPSLPNAYYEIVNTLTEACVLYLTDKANVILSLMTKIK